MGSSQVIILKAFLLSGFFTCCVSLRCIECMQNLQQEDPGCGDNFSWRSEFQSYCDGTCLKRRGERYSNGVRYVEIYRTCVEQRDSGCYDTTWNGIDVTACACNTDLCNTSPPSQSAPKGLFLQLVLALAAWLIHRLVAGC